MSNDNSNVGRSGIDTSDHDRPSGVIVYDIGSIARQAAEHGTPS